MRRGGKTETGGLRTPMDGSQPLAVAALHESLAPSSADLEAYLALLAHLDMPVSMKIELIIALRAMMQNFVDRAFGDDPVQLAAQGRGQQIETDAESAESMISSNAENSDNPNMLSNGFQRSAKPGGGKVMER